MASPCLAGPALDLKGALAASAARKMLRRSASGAQRNDTLTDNQPQWRIVVIASLVAVGLSACSYGLRPPVVEAGRGFSPGFSDRVKKGDDAA
jgi:hypothetical protein